MAHLQIETILRSRKNGFIKVFNEGTTCFIVHNRPQKSNAFTLDMYINMADAIQHANKDSAIKFIVVYAEGKNFSTGNDLGNFMDPEFGNITRSVNLYLFSKLSHIWLKLFLKTLLKPLSVVQNQYLELFKEWQQDQPLLNSVYMIEYMQFKVLYLEPL